MIGAPSSSWVTVSRQNPDWVGAISQVIRVNPSDFIASLNRNR